MEAFRRALEDYNLMDIGFSGNWFTWERGNLPETNIQERLDRGVATDSWLALFPDFQVRHLPHSFSDHCPLLINTKCEDMRKAKKEMLHLKLTKLLGEDRSNENLADLIDTKVDLNFEIEKDRRYWEQQARVNWLKLGNKNTAFFHRQVTQRWRKNCIQKLQYDDGRETELFLAGRRGNYDHILSSIDRCIFEEDDSKLRADFTKEEILEALKEMGPTKTPGEDGFPALFYQKCWPIIGEDVMSYCLNVLNGAKVNANCLRLVMDKCIDLAQSSFMLRRSIFDNVILAYELLHTLKHKRVGKKGFMPVKLDMSKAYDRVEWGFVKGL
ncbi:hypothetical protein PVK06_027883 [Gossypium arboreum]|uniref:Reverse transcriptase n=1 Tax=Gossypium arboreum TaxID=29729 RepID=A0ABR0P1K7_GOSAR|nr:hypothetical protein PVK06_027883 [Gossypium arboreum]